MKLLPNRLGTELQKKQVVTVAGPTVKGVPIGTIHKLILNYIFRFSAQYFAYRKNEQDNSSNYGERPTDIALILKLADPETEK